MTTDNEKDMTGITEMDALLRRADFAAESPGLEERLWAKIQAKLWGRRHELCALASEWELSENELSELAAAGTPETQAVEKLRGVWLQNQIRRP